MRKQSVRIKIWGKEYFLSKEKYMKVVLEKSSFITEMALARFKRHHGIIASMSKKEEELKSCLEKTGFRGFLEFFYTMLSSRILVAKSKQRAAARELKMKHFKEYEAILARRRLGVSKRPIPLFLDQ